MLLAVLAFHRHVVATDYQFVAVHIPTVVGIMLCVMPWRELGKDVRPVLLKALLGSVVVFLHSRVQRNQKH